MGRDKQKTEPYQARCLRGAAGLNDWPTSGAKLKNMKRGLRIILICIVLSSCSKNKHNFKLTSKVKTLVDSLSISKSKLTPELVFIGDDYPKVTKPYHEFIQVASTDELVFLTKNKKPNIRCYAFNGLIRRDFSGVRKIFSEHIKDTAVINLYFGGCIISKMTVMEFMIDQLHPYESESSEKLSRKEYNEYRKLAESWRKKATK